MSEEKKLREESPAEPADSPEEPAPEPAEELHEDPDSPPEGELHSPADERLEDQPHDPTPAPRACTMSEESTQSRKKGAEWPPHPLWRGWWLAVVLLASIVVLGQEPPRLSDWVNPPLRPFAGGILLGCALGALPRVLRKRGGEAS